MEVEATGPRNVHEYDRVGYLFYTCSNLEERTETTLPIRVNMTVMEVMEVDAGPKRGTRRVNAGQ